MKPEPGSFSGFFVIAYPVIWLFQALGWLLKKIVGEKATKWLGDLFVALTKAYFVIQDEKKKDDPK